MFSVRVARIYFLAELIQSNGQYDRKDLHIVYERRCTDGCSKGISILGGFDTELRIAEERVVYASENRTVTSEHQHVPVGGISARDEQATRGIDLDRFDCLRTIAVGDNHRIVTH